MATKNSHASGSNRLFVLVWIWLLLLTAIEIAFAYQGLALVMMIVILLGLSIMKSALIMSYFMHLKFERLALTFVLVPALVICISLMLIFMFPDSVRLGHWRIH